MANCFLSRTMASLFARGYEDRRNRLAEATGRQLQFVTVATSKHIFAFDHDGKSYADYRRG